MSSRPKILELALGLMLLLSAAALIYTARRMNPFGTFSPLEDDAYITLRFAHHVAQGHGFVWNIGGPPVSGFTSLLHVLILAGIEKLGLTPLAHVPLMGALLAVVTLGLSLLLFERLNPLHRAENLTGAILLGLVPGLWHWAPAGLETTLFGALLTGCVLAYVCFRRTMAQSVGLGALFGLAALTRPEGALLFAATLVFEAVRAWRLRESLAVAIQMLLGFALIYGPAFIWQWAYFGDPLPNTYYDKTGAGWIQIAGGWEYLRRSLIEVARQSYWLPVVALLALLKPAGARLYVFFLLLVACALIVAEGGDHFPRARFIIPILPLWFGLFSLGLSELTDRGRTWGRVGLIAAATLLAVVAFDPMQTLQVKPGWARLPRPDPTSLEYQSKDWVANFPVMGKALRDIAAPGQSIAVVPIGAIGYYSDLNVIDMLGLTDAHIARLPFDPAYVSTWMPGHDKGDGAYVLSQRPDYIQLITRLTSQPRPGLDSHDEQYKSPVEIWNSAEFQRDYEFFAVQVESGWYYNLYRRRTTAPGT